MKMRRRTRSGSVAIVYGLATVLLAIAGIEPSFARPRPPLPPLPEFAPLLSRAGFDEPFWARVAKPEAFHPAYVDLVDGWSGYSLRRAGKSVTPFIVPGWDETARVQPNGADEALRFWFRPSWSSGAGPGVVARLVQLSAVGNSDAVSAWSLLVSPDGSVLSLAGPDGALLRTEINWRADEWHLVALNYGPDRSALFIDGALRTEGGGTLAVPPPVAAFSVGSTLTGADPAGGEFDEFCVFAGALSEPAVVFCHQLYAPTAARGPISPEEEAAQREAATKRRAERAAAGEGGGTQMLRLLGGTSQCITSPVVFITNIVAGFDTNAGWTNMFDIQGGTNGFFYDIFSTTNLTGDSITNSQWTWLERGPTCSTYLYTNQPPAYAFYVLGTSQDTDNDGLTDAYEQLVSKTSTTNANSPRAIYEAVIAGQSPSNWFKLNDGSLTNAISGQAVTTLTNGGGAWDVDAFAIGNGAFSFTNAASVLTAGDVISGGTGTNQGSVSLLFRSLSGQATAKRYLFSQKGASGTEFGVYFDDGGLRVQTGSQTNVILQTNAIVFETWYYLAMTWDETRPDTNGAEVTWYLGRVGETLTNGSINLTDSAVVGSISNVYVGNRQNNNGTFSSAFREGGNSFGALDEIAFWTREMSGPEVNAQFNTLKALFQGPSKVFDLTRWNILLPINRDGQLSGTDPLELRTGWLNSGFKYVDPTDWTQKYFYLSGDNKMVFEAPCNGAKTPTSSGPRSELRGTLADGNEDNWTPLGTNTFEATCAVQSAGTNGTNKVIIGQIYSKSAGSPTFAVNYNFPQVKQVSVTYKFNPTNSTDDNLILATNVNLLDLIHYKVQMTDDGTTVSLHGEASTNGVPYPPPTDKTLIPYSAWHNATFYFKAECYFPNNPVSGTAKVTFSSLEARHGP